MEELAVRATQFVGSFKYTRVPQLYMPERGALRWYRDPSWRSPGRALVTVVVFVGVLVPTAPRCVVCAQVEVCAV